MGGPQRALLPRSVLRYTPDQSIIIGSNTPGSSVFSQVLYVEFHIKGIFDMELGI